MLQQLLALQGLLIVSTYGVEGSVQGIWVKPDANGVHQGESAGFQCKVRGSVSHLTVQHWELNGRRVTSTGRVTIEPPDRLVIANSRPDDSGRYTCIAEINGNVYRASQILTVYRPMVTYPMPAMRAVVGTDCILRCDGKYYERILWKRNSRYVNKWHPSGRFSLLGNGSQLSITNVSFADNGTYTCQFLAGTRAHRDVELLVVVPVTRVVASVSKPTVEVGHSLQLRCRANGYPSPGAVAWYKGSTELLRSDRVSVSYDQRSAIALVTIHELTRYDSGTYNCSFRQWLVSDRYQFQSGIVAVSVIGKPDPPTSLVATVQIFPGPSMRLQVNLSWRKPIYTGQLQMLGYRIRYWDSTGCKQYLADCSIEEYWLDSSRNSYNLSLEDYDDGSRLCFAVQSVNNDGLSKSSRPECVTVERIESLAPATIQSPAVMTSEVVHPTASQVTSIKPTSPVATIQPTKRSVRRDFHVVMKNEEELCLRSVQVDESTMARALAAHFSWLCSCFVPASDVKTLAFNQIGGVLLYRGSVLNSAADRLVSNLSYYIQAGPARPQIQLKGTFFTFLKDCPMSPQRSHHCRIDGDDKKALSCSVNLVTIPPSPAAPVTCNPNPETSWSLLQIGVVSGMGAVIVIQTFLLTMVLQFCLQARRKLKSRRRRIDSLTARGQRFATGPSLTKDDLDRIGRLAERKRNVSEFQKIEIGAGVRHCQNRSSNGPTSSHGATS